MANRTMAHMDKAAEPQHLLTPSPTPVYDLGQFLTGIIELATYEHIDHDAENEDAHEAAHGQAWDLKLTKLQLAQLAAEALDDIGCFDCLWCGTDTGNIGEYYMVRNEIWQLYGPKRRGMLCIGCLENQMGRTLQPGDFTESILNDPNKRHISDDLRNRLTGTS